MEMDILLTVLFSIACISVGFWLSFLVLRSWLKRSTRSVAMVHSEDEGKKGLKPVSPVTQKKLPR